MQDQDDAPQNSRRGGRQPGAGAPRGNSNALKHGRTTRAALDASSRRLKRLRAIRGAVQGLRQALVALAGA